MDLRDHLRVDLVRALKEGDTTTVSVLRTLLAAVANSEAPALADVAAPPTRARVNEVMRLELSPADLQRVVAIEIADRVEAVELYAGRGADEPAAALRVEIAVLERYCE